MTAAEVVAYTAPCDKHAGHDATWTSTTTGPNQANITVRCDRDPLPGWFADMLRHTSRTA